MSGQTAPAQYEIRIRGVLGETLLVAFPDLHAETQAGVTLLTGALVDRAALHGVLAEIEALGLELLELRRLPSEPANRPVGVTTAHPTGCVDALGPAQGPPRRCREEQT